MSTTNRHSTTDSLCSTRMTYDLSQFDDETRRLLRATIDWFEHRGKERLLEDLPQPRLVCRLPRVRRQGAIVRQDGHAGARRQRRSRQAVGHQPDLGVQRDPGVLRTGLLVRLAGHHPRPGTDLAERERLGTQPRGQWLDDGAVFVFGLSEREHGADIYTTDLVLTPDGEGGFRATGGKYYIGNGNVARMVSVFGRRSDVAGPRGTCSSQGQPAQELQAVQERRPGPDVRLRVPGWRTTRCARRTCCTPVKRPSMPR